MKPLAEKIVLTTRDAPTPVQDVGTLLDKNNLSYQALDHYYQVGEITPVQGWILHISVIKYQLLELLEMVIPVLTKEKTPFKVAKSLEVAAKFLDGGLGYAQLGKVVSIYPENNEQAIRLAHTFITQTQKFLGPIIPTDVPLGGAVYTRYGSFNPILKHDAMGRPLRYIYDTQGQLVPDVLWSPFKMPRGIAWPFSEIRPLTKPLKHKLLLHNKYKIMYMLKADVKGRVMKALRRTGVTFQWCVVKEGKQGMWADPTGRDIQDRLKGQYKLQRALGDTVALPKAYDLFTEDGNTYFVMQYIKGKSLEETIYGLYQNTGPWQNQSPADQQQLIHWLLQIVILLKNMHAGGYVHRDASLSNFIIDKNNTVYAIDLELAYSLKEDADQPPFTLGTPGFMSPEQTAKQTPTVKEDIFALGALMTSFFTGFHPLKFYTVSTDRMARQLSFFIPYEAIVQLIVQCHQPDAEIRPTITAIEQAVRHLQETNSRNSTKKAFATPKKPEPAVIDKILTGYVQTLKKRVNDENLWYSNAIVNDVVAKGVKQEKAVYTGLHTGIAGPLYMASLLQRCGIPTDDAAEIIQHNYDYLRRTVIQSSTLVTPGLYYGAAGVAIALKEALETELLQPADEITDFMTHCFTLSPTGLDMAHGVSGQGMALLQCAQYLPKELVEKQLNTYVDVLITHQQTDGSWILSENGAKKKNILAAGFSHGIAGMTCFLLEYHRLNHDSLSKTAASKALKWLYKHALQKNGTYNWPVTSQNKQSTSGIDFGSAGVALCFIRAYEILGNHLYKQVAEGALNSIPKYVIKDTLMMNRGLCGIGEAYLEAYRVFKEDTWWERTAWIIQICTHTCLYAPDGTTSWNTETNKIKTVDFFSNNSGVVHFLLRSTKPVCKGLPFLPLTQTR